MIAWEGDTLTVGDWSVPVPPHHPDQTGRVGIPATATPWNIPVTVWRIFRPGMETGAKESDARGVLLQFANGYGIGVYIRPETRRKRSRIYLWVADGGDPKNNGRSSVGYYGPSRISAELYYLNEDPSSRLPT